METLARYRLRDMLPMRAAVKSIEHVAISSEVQHALVKWIKNNRDTSGVLIGGLAMSFYAKPRYTEAVDLLFLDSSDVPGEVAGFKHHRPGAFEDKDTNVEVECTTPRSFSEVPLSILRRVVQTSIMHDGLKVASHEGLIALKLFSADGISNNIRRKHKDLADITQLLAYKPTTMEAWSLPGRQLLLLQEARDSILDV